MVRASLANKRIGQVKINKFGSTMTVEEYKNSNDILVRFIDSGHKTHTTWYAFVKGGVKSPYDKTIFGVGYLGEGKYTATINDKMSKHYEVWYNMLKRGYSSKYKEKRHSYLDCTVAEEWHNFQNFAKWWDENYYEIDNEIMSIDKDILMKGNKEYSSRSCVIVPLRINSLIFLNENCRGLLPIGVKRYKNGYEAICSIGSKKHQYIGFFYDPNQAFKAYKTFKENYVKQVAEKYKGKIPNNVYEALISFTVEIDD